ncbi:MAG: 30S ribosomal protein S9 [Chloroflexi bacterium]|nr:30S ribosomal protein S9 [Chloroflexota bacterium]
MTEQHYYYGTGKRKTAIAQVRLYPGRSDVTVNEKPLENAFPLEAWRSFIREPLGLTDTDGKVGIVVKVHGGGVIGQAGAIRHGIARALLAYDENVKSALRERGLLTRDSRIKESKKYGLKRARRAPQYTKR